MSKTGFEFPYMEGKVMEDEKKYLLDTLLKRLDIHTNAINTKAAFVIAFNTFIIGITILNYTNIVAGFTSENIKTLVPIILLMILFASGMSVFRIFKAVSPFLESGKTNKYDSLLFFGAVSQLSLDRFKSQVNNLTSKDLIDDLIRQTHILSSGVNAKFDNVAKSFFWTIYFVLCPIGIILFLRILDWKING